MKPIHEMIVFVEPNCIACVRVMETAEILRKRGFVANPLIINRIDDPESCAKFGVAIYPAVFINGRLAFYGEFSVEDAVRFALASVIHSSSDSAKTPTPFRRGQVYDSTSRRLVEGEVCLRENFIENMIHLTHNSHNKSQSIKRSNTMKTILMMSLAVLLTVALATPASAQAKNGMKEITVVGEIIDTKCYITGMMGGRGEEHKQCAIDCINGGLPVGVVEDKTDKVYVLVPQKGGTKGANEELVQYAAQTVKLTGSVVEKGGQKLLVYSKVEAVR